MSKYGAIRTTVNGITFDSKAEARRHGQLVLLERAGRIKDLKRQVQFLVAPGVRLHGEKRARPAIRYLADFVYQCPIDGTVIEDVKGMDTPMSRLKRHLVKTVLGLDVRLVT